MSFSLTPETQKLILERMQQDGYSSADELVRAALASLDLPDQLDNRDVADLRVSICQMNRGEVIDWKQLSSELRRKYLSE